MEFIIPTQPFQVNGYTINPSEIEQCIRDNKIGLIKNYRGISGKGLKEAKDTIDSCYCDGTYGTILDRMKVWKLFLSALPQFQEMQPSPATNILDEQFRESVNLAITSYRDYGYTNPVDMVGGILLNFKKKYERGNS